VTRVLLPAGARYEALVPALEEAGFRPEVTGGPTPAPPASGAGRVTAAVVPEAGLDAWRRLPPARRRRFLVVAVVTSGTTGDPLAALARDVNLVVTEEDLSRLPELLGVAVEDHLRLVHLLDPEAAP